jgi:tetratricopeptide (TPR) repeat protein
MTSVVEIQKLAEDGKLAFAEGQYESAAGKFQEAAAGYTSLQDDASAAEMKNNTSVALLQLDKAQEALSILAGTDEVFARMKDLKRQGLAVGNQAAALDALGRSDEAFAAYERSAQLFADAGEGDLRSVVLKSGAAIKLRRGKILEAALKMYGSLEAKPNPSIFERILKFLIHFLQR